MDPELGRKKDRAGEAAIEFMRVAGLALLNAVPMDLPLIGKVWMIPEVRLQAVKKAMEEFTDAVDELPDDEDVRLGGLK